jgi:DNA-binding winged helix-turn-helix (wHTH) protein/TolB-like protein
MQTLRFETFTLDAASGLLMQGERRIALRRQAFAVLLYLAERPGRLVTNKELIESCWDNPRQTSVNSLAQCIKAIREALGASEHEIIRTVHGQGYVFAAPVATAAAESTGSHAPAAEPDVSATPAPPQTRSLRYAVAAVILLLAVLAGATWAVVSRLGERTESAMMAAPSIAVLAFEAVGEQSQRSGAAGTLADDVTTELARTPRGYDLRIRSASGYALSGAPARQAGRELGVRYLVLATMRRDGVARQVNVQLIEANGDRPIWAELFGYAPDEPGAQNRLAERIARAIGAQVLRAESRRPLPAVPQAGHFVILGRSLMSGQGGAKANQNAMAFFDKARALDPNSVPALLGYARTRVNAVLNGWVPADEANALLDAAEPAIKRAIEIDSRDVGLHVLRGAYLRARGREPDAIAAFQRALELLPSYAVAHAELGRAKIEVGLADQAMAEIEEALRLSPDDPYVGAWYFWAGMAEVHVGHYRGAVTWLLRARNENRVQANTSLWLAVAYGGLEEWGEAGRYLREHSDAAPKFSIASWKHAFASEHPTVAAQRARIVAILCHLGAPGCPATSNALQ